MKVLVATGIEKLDEDILKMLPDNNMVASGQCFHRNVLHKVINESAADTLVISTALSGDSDLISLIRSIREKGTRVIVLPGSSSLPQTLELVKALVPYGIYDFVYDKVKPKDVIDRVRNPGNLGEVAKSFVGASIDLDISSDIEKYIPKEICEEGYVGSQQSVDDSIACPNNQQDEVEQCLPKEFVSEANEEKTFKKIIKEQDPSKPLFNSKNIKVKFKMPKLPKFQLRHTQKQDVRYISHHIVAVWSPVGGSLKSITALNLAVTAVNQGFDASLINFDLTCPILDKWFKIPNTALDKVKDARGAGVMTFGPDFNPDLTERMLKDYNWGVKYLPAGNKFGNIGTPEIPLDVLEEIIQKVYRREVNGRPAVTIIDTSPVFELPITFAALKNASMLLIPITNKQEAELVYDQLTELERIKIKPKIIEVIWCESKFYSKNIQITIPFIEDIFIKASNQRKPYCDLLEHNPFKQLLESALSG